MRRRRAGGVTNVAALMAGTAGATYGAEATALFARMSVQPDSTRKTLIDNLCNALVSAGVWAKLDCLYVTAAHDAQAARLNWVSSSYNVVAGGSPTFTTDRGYTGDGVGATLSSTFNPSTSPSPKYAQDNAIMFAWVGTDVTASTQIDCGHSPTLAFICSHNTTSTPRMRISVATNAAPTLPANTGVGLLAALRTSSAGMDGYKNATALSNTAATSTGVGNGVFSMLCANGAANFSARTVAASGLGSALTPTEYGNFYSALSTYMVAIGAP